MKLQIKDLVNALQIKFELETKKDVCQFLSITQANLSMSIKRNSVGPILDATIKKVSIEEFKDILNIVEQNSTIESFQAEKIFDKLIDLFEAKKEAVNFAKKFLIALTTNKKKFVFIFDEILNKLENKDTINKKEHVLAVIQNEISLLTKIQTTLNSHFELDIIKEFFSSLDDETISWILHNKKQILLVIEASFGGFDLAIDRKLRQ